MLTLHGQSIHPGIACGPVYFYQREEPQWQPRASSARLELERFERARAQALDMLDKLARREAAQSCQNKAPAQVFDVHRLMLQDEDFVGAAREFIGGGASAAQAVELAAKQLAGRLEQSPNQYIRQRAEDIWDAARGVIDFLEGGPTDLELPGHPVVLAADRLMPSQLAALSPRPCALVLAGSAEHSHTAVLARAMDIPAVCGVGEGLTPELCGAPAIVDADAGKVYIRPDSATIARVASPWKPRPLKEAAQPCTTRDGVPVVVSANIARSEEAALALEQGADAVGLLRSELLFLGADTCPGEDEQLAVYRQILEVMAGKRVCIRTLDVGGDKPATYLPLPREENPALGLRGGRVSLEYPELLRAQLRAIYRVSAYGQAAILFPMVSALWEARQLLDHAAKARAELHERGIPFDASVPLGLMIETPAAALISAELAPLCDFFSIGTGDLAQYTLAADRQSGSVASYYDPAHPAVLRLIELTCQSAAAAGIPVSLCGELAGDHSLTRQLLGMGIREFSVVPRAVAGLKEKIREISRG